MRNRINRSCCRSGRRLISVEHTDHDLSSNPDAVSASTTGPVMTANRRVVPSLETSVPTRKQVTSARQLQARRRTALYPLLARLL